MDGTALTPGKNFFSSTAERVFPEAGYHRSLTVWADPPVARLKRFEARFYGNLGGRAPARGRRIGRISLKSYKLDPDTGTRYARR